MSRDDSRAWRSRLARLGRAYDLPAPLTDEQILRMTVEQRADLAGLLISGSLRILHATALRAGMLGPGGRLWRVPLAITIREE